MTPTEQDKELRAKLDELLETLLGHLGDRDDRDNWWGFDTNVGTLEDEIEGTLDSVVQLITADRKRVALEARIDELENRLRVQFIPSHWARLCAEVNSWAKYVDRRIAELKAQQEEV